MLNVIILVCRWCGDALMPVPEADGGYVHEKDGWSLCWDGTGGHELAEPTSGSSR